ncbi:hypothetical protein HQO42_13700 [Rhodococcus fascians]|nr:hypothetical protein [Rhodococcus fascians]MBY4239557.1 hypothetical protein [Rhodococcus fascians]MBY4253711.1 hypothetical protein [Rhodococcus fascians]MBY4271146.1 hypothetical protein [Rhodococcus fascians]
MTDAGIITLTTAQLNEMLNQARISATPLPVLATIEDPTNNSNNASEDLVEETLQLSPDNYATLKAAKYAMWGTIITGTITAVGLLVGVMFNAISAAEAVELTPILNCVQQQREVIEIVTANPDLPLQYSGEAASQCNLNQVAEGVRTTR